MDCDDHISYRLIMLVYYFYINLLLYHSLIIREILNSNDDVSDKKSLKVKTK